MLRTPTHSHRHKATELLAEVMSACGGGWCQRYCMITLITVATFLKEPVERMMPAAAPSFSQQGAEATKGRFSPIFHSAGFLLGDGAKPSMGAAEVMAQHY